MSYADQQMSGNRLTALIIVALIHLVVGYALVTGLAYSAAKQIMKHVTTVDIKKDEPKPPPPPPPPKNAPPPPPIVAPPPPVNIAVAPPAIETRPTAPPIVIAPPAPAAPRFQAKGPSPKNQPSMWVTTDDYPPRALREMRGGSTAFRLTVGPDGRVTGCEVTGSSGSPDLDQAACTYASRRARFAPAMDGDGQPTSGSYSSRVKWVPQEG